MESSKQSVVFSRYVLCFPPLTVPLVCLKQNPHTARSLSTRNAKLGYLSTEPLPERREARGHKHTKPIRSVLRLPAPTHAAHTFVTRAHLPQEVLRRDVVEASAIRLSDGETPTTMTTPFSDEHRKTCLVDTGYIGGTGRRIHGRASCEHFFRYANL